MSPLNYLLAGAACCLFVGEAVAHPSDVAVGYSAGFDIEYVVPVTEASIANRGCKFTIELSSFLGLLVVEPTLANAVTYAQQPDYRAQVVSFDGEDYFIQRAGIVRRGASYWKIDLGRFTGAQHTLLTGNCAPMGPMDYTVRYGPRSPN